MKNGIYTSVRKVSSYPTYKGYIACFNNGMRLWGETAGPERLCREHALEDAQRRKADRDNSVIG